MRRFTITVNGQAYDVLVEETAVGAAPAAAPAPVVSAPAPAAAAPAPAAPAAPAASAGAKDLSGVAGAKVNAPMPGKILAVKVSVGQAVKRGDVLLILEAMKMENEIQSPVDGKVAAIAVSEGANVQAGTALASIE